MGLPPADCIFVDDHALNLPPAGALGITTVHAVSEASTVKLLEELLGVQATSAAC